jgi:hypothetical protein
VDFVVSARCPKNWIRSGMPGYSGTPLPKKLGIKNGFHICLVNAPADVRGELRGAMSACEVMRVPRGPLDFVMLFTKSHSELSREFSRLAKELSSAGMLWISWPKKTSGVATDLDENLIRDVGLSAGLVDVKVCAVTEVWSGLKFVRRIADRKNSSRKK